MKYAVLKSAIAVTLLAAAGTASALTKTTTFQVTASVANNCFIDSASTLAFGPYDPSSAAVLDGASNIVVRCTNKTPYTLSLNAGTTTGGTFTNRLMTTGTDTLQYNLYTTTARTTVWGDGTAGTGTVAKTGAGLTVGNAQTTQVFGRIPVQPDAAVGNYSDTVTVTVTY
jgi:spore coat protein U-like protein